MKKYQLLFSFIFIQLNLQHAYGQCMMTPLSIDERIQHAETIIVGSLKKQESYWDDRMENIYTSNTISITAYLKGHNSSSEIILITEGGIVANQAQSTYPSISLDDHHEIILMLEKENFKDDNKLLRVTSPALKQAKAYASGQGVLILENGSYHDLLKESPHSEAEVFSLIKSATGETPKTPDGTIFTARQFENKTPSPAPSGNGKLRTLRTQALSSFNPTTTVGGTVNTGDFVTITGSAFGATQGSGTVYFRNADDGGATLIASPYASDYVSWSDNSITVKVPDNAGTGNMMIVNNAGTSFPAGSPLTITYSQTALTDNTNLWPVPTRMRPYLRNMNGSGGYTFFYNSTGTNGSSIAFSSQSTAKASFERALQSWRCATFVNFSVSNTSTTLGIASDNFNVISFDAGLPAGVLGLATSRYSTNTNPGCTQANTVWCIYEIDIQFDDVLSTGFTWQFGPAAPGGTQYDFESVAVHELGHAHGLGHIINPGKVMHYAIANGSSVRALIPTTETAGGQDKMSYCTVATCHNPGGCGTGPMVALSAGSCVLTLGILSFQGDHEPQKGNHLAWSMIVEKNTRVDVLRSSDGINFDVISSLNTGVSTGLLNSEYTDYDIRGNEKYFYKLMLQTAYESAYSSTVYVAPKNTNEYLVFYNAADKNIYIKSGVPDENIIFYLYDMKGSLINKKAFSADANTEKTITFNAMPAGIYLYNMSTENKIFSGKIIIE